MTSTELAGTALRGAYRDVLRDVNGAIVYDGGWRSNAIAADCRRLLAAFMRGKPSADGLRGLHVGAGVAAWDQSGTPPADPAQEQLRDPDPHTVPLGELQVDFLAGSAVSEAPTSRIQVRARLGPGEATGNLREFGLVARLGGATVLVNYVTHMVIAKDPASTLERTIWLEF